MTAPETVMAILECNGGELIGRTRLQKSFYFLEAARVGYGFDFSYHYYGPYSEDLAIAASDAEALGLIRTNWERTQTGLEYSVYRVASAERLEKDELFVRRKEVLGILSRFDAISLELAATAHYLTENGYEADPWEETCRRKTVKATPDRIAKAQKLLKELAL